MGCSECLIPRSTPPPPPSLPPPRLPHSDYHLVVGVHCATVRAGQAIVTLEQALETCTSLDDCAGIRDWGCTGGGFRLCTRSAYREVEKSDNCIYRKSSLTPKPPPPPSPSRPPWLVVPPNVLFIVSDDLTLEVPVPAHTPHIDALKASGVSFAHAYAQIATCAPSRTSFLTSLRPDQTGSWTLDKTDQVREVEPDDVPFTLLPQHFRNNGYFVRAYGKVLHEGRNEREVGRSYDEYFNRFEGMWIYNDDGTVREGWTKAQLERVDGDRQVAAYDMGQNSSGATVQDGAYDDGAWTDDAAAWLRGRPADSQPFFLAMGYKKPHLPFNAPKKYWDLYQPSQFEAVVPDSYDGIRRMPSGTMRFTAPLGTEIFKFGATNYKPRNPFALWPGVPNSETCDGTAGAVGCYLMPTPTLPEARALLHGYLACISFIDAQVGKLTAALQEGGHADNTITVFTSDHGFHLGDRSGFWAKHTNFEAATRVPLIFASPWLPQPGTDAVGVAELVDIYPTLIALVEERAPGTFYIPPNHQLAGTSLLPTLLDPSRTPAKTVAFSQFHRTMVTYGPSYGEPAQLPNMGGSDKAVGMGYTIRVVDGDLDYRYTEWWRVSLGNARTAPPVADESEENMHTRWCADASQPSSCVAGPAFRELYYYTSAPLIETVNSIVTIAQELALPLSDSDLDNGLGDGWKRCASTTSGTPGLFHNMSCISSRPAVG